MPELVVCIHGALPQAALSLSVFPNNPFWKPSPRPSYFHGQFNSWLLYKSPDSWLLTTVFCIGGIKLIFLLFLLAATSCYYVSRNLIWCIFLLSLYGFQISKLTQSVKGQGRGSPPWFRSHQSAPVGGDNIPVVLTLNPEHSPSAGIVSSPLNLAAQIVDQTLQKWVWGTFPSTFSLHH